MLITPRPGVPRDSVINTLRGVSQNLASLQGPGPETAYQRLLRYLEWANRSAEHLHSQISSKDIDRLIRTRQYYAILGAFGGLASIDHQTMVNGLILQEAEERSQALGEATKSLFDYGDRWKSPTLVVADSSFYLNSPAPFADTDFHQTLGLFVEYPIHVLFPMVVVDELKESRGNHRRWRAGHTLGRLDEAIPSGTVGTLHGSRPGEGQSIIGRVSVEIVLDAPGHVRLPNPDDEIIDRAATIQAIANQKVRLLTCDTGQATRGRMADLNVTKLPSNAGSGPEPPREYGDQARGSGTRAQRKTQREAEAEKTDTSER